MPNLMIGQLLACDKRTRRVKKGAGASGGTNPAPDAFRCVGRPSRPAAGLRLIPAAPHPLLTVQGSGRPVPAAKSPWRAAIREGNVKKKTKNGTVPAGIRRARYRVMNQSPRAVSRLRREEP